MHCWSCFENRIEYDKVSASITITFKANNSERVSRMLEVDRRRACFADFALIMSLEGQKILFHGIQKLLERWLAALTIAECYYFMVDVENCKDGLNLRPVRESF